ncbi:unnamed protein product [Nippostrongylus brasiliensis]|uniref:Uncharacterized protein n=1 Tax=Nippostrongylus brasiliensis TaxID=27835 RepID=A0A0N4YQD8_NIPBR|nr:hypothetical protein Q1695_003187 [Nippostrongylus brasiliensis]VDL83198.1 unnamed protein product [Nippostrongylus brasiliensis]
MSNVLMNLAARSISNASDMSSKQTVAERTDFFSGMGCRTRCRAKEAWRSGGIPCPTFLELRRWLGKEQRLLYGGGLDCETSGYFCLPGVFAPPKGLIHSDFLPRLLILDVGEFLKVFCDSFPEVVCLVDNALDLFEVVCKRKIEAFVSTPTTVVSLKDFLSSEIFWLFSSASSSPSMSSTCPIHLARRDACACSPGWESVVTCDVVRWDDPLRSSQMFFSTSSEIIGPMPFAT